MRHVVAVLVVVAAAVPAGAHIQLDSPRPRYANTPSEVNKHCPCGGGAGTSSCSGSVQSDPNRSDRVTTYAPGETITVEWRETIGHTGRFRIAFDADGADLDDFNQNILLDTADPSGGAGNTGLGNRWSAEVRLPTTPCTNCTLQLLQIMNGNTTNAVTDPTGSSTYFQCADLIISGDVVAEGEGEGGEGEAEAAEGEGEGNAVGGGCSQSQGLTATPALLLALAVIRRRRRRLAC